MKQFQLAQINVAKMKGVNINDPMMKEFVDNLDAVNALAEMSEGFVWRLKEDNNNATDLDPYQDPTIITNISVWRDVSTLQQFTYRSFHSDFLKRRREWFSVYGKVYMAMWWVPSGEYPTMEQAMERVEYLAKNGPSQYAFSFKNSFSMP
ncbi:DUF3291 domain-containing protein [Dyadobacter chenwenxiniae]|uniref:DUF3291 domain-containing protein n=1 Tax=Dyadobacter chenwenxiniae TaxID=2906456 RepID=A0A9X1PPG1_9BACT|nr:DUF3291 domain-containing protein [Dyadobacter chenwenxiniae]MCF0063749.1 DUF3291 domain-containing protein [Dyadobacter chenwenxiniae]UON83424.1 DUF3291 domain-containing protein [Dyadobacter chenwenxiniae]